MLQELGCKVSMIGDHIQDWFERMSFIKTYNGKHDYVLQFCLLFNIIN